MLNCLRFLEMGSLADIERMSFYEYALRMKARRLRAVDQEYAWHREAWINRQVKAEKKKGKNGSEYVYKRFERFFDYEKLERAAQEDAPDAPEVSDTAQRYMAYMKRSGARTGDSRFDGVPPSGMG